MECDKVPLVNLFFGTVKEALPNEKYRLLKNLNMNSKKHKSNMLVKENMVNTKLICINECTLA